jgi:hypothetical protein
MSNLREIAEDSRYSTIRIKCTLIPFPVSLELPESIKETLPRTVTKAIEGIRIMRFYAPPVPGDTIEFRGFLFKVLGRHHEDLKVKGSPQKDRMPIVITEFIGAVE